MKTFGLFMFIWLCTILATFNVFSKVSDREISLMILATLIAFIFYKTFKEDE